MGLCVEGDKFLYVAGTFNYMAPEVAGLWLGLNDYYDKRCDMWSLGVVMFETFTCSLSVVAATAVDCVCLNNDRKCDFCKEDLFRELRVAMLDKLPDNLIMVILSFFLILEANKIYRIVS
ncbi:hypothetical protein HELRODRAFT_173931 [Helobdella robusta]|uniref:Protein kinase domain-containing protein n=1 Tax=Helobdella robusta TaxID=6412 RepID=T1F7E1_HELRO|nr:hypothetical protein HELRODRAFT_173931 [Helobdella robusta]ESO03057.1 hypothetical protein HELRODRAFT_173931 [Helobdella robusta]